MVYICDNQSVWTEVNGWLEEGGKATLATALSRQMTKSSAYSLSRQMINEQADAAIWSRINGTGHLGPCYDGVANVRRGRGQQLPRGPVAL